MTTKPTFFQRVNALFQPPAAAPQVAVQPLNAGPSPGDQAVMVLNRLERYLNQAARTDMRTWFTARAMARNPQNPRRQQLYAIYDRALTDDHLSSVIQTRKLKVLKQPRKLLRNGVAVPKAELNELLGPVIDQILEHALDSRFWGHSLVEVQFEAGRIVRLELVPREHVRPETGEVLRSPHDVTGLRYRLENVLPYNATWRPGEQPIQLPSGHILLEIGGMNSLGLLEQASRNVIRKQIAEMAWSDYAEVFGLPIRSVKMPSILDKETKSELEGNIKKMGRGGFITYPEGFEFELHEVSSSDAHQVFDKLVERCNEGNSKLVLGQTMTTDNGSSRAQAQVHERVANDYIEADKRFLAGFMNAQLLPLLAYFDNSYIGLRFEFTAYQEMSQTDRVAVLKELHGMGFDFDTEEIEQEFGIRVTRRPPAATGGASA